MTQIEPVVRPASRTENLRTSLFATWLILGLFVDGWAHNNQPELESFWTPWHGLFYSGFTATALWILWMMRSRLVSGVRLVDSLPTGYRSAATGLLIFAIGGVGDAIWHTVFGVETSFDALLSPTHILLFIGIILVVSAPLRSISAQHPERDLPRREFVPVGISMALAILLVGFFFMYAYAPASGAVTVEFIPNVTGGLVAEYGLLQIYMSTAILTGGILYLTSRWRPPLGTFTIVFTALGFLFSGMLDQFADLWQVLAPVAGGVAADVVVQLADPSPQRRGAFLVLGAAVPIVSWTTHMAAYAAFEEIGWTVELWAGAVAVAGLIGAGIAHAMSHAAQRPAEVRASAAVG